MEQPDTTRRDALYMVAFFVVLVVAYLLLRPGQSPREDTVTTPQVKTISPAEFRDATGEGRPYVLLDVRQPDEYAEAHIPGSLLVPLSPEEDFRAGVLERIPDKTMPVIIYCRSGRRSGIAAEYLLEMGYTDVYNLGGIQDWPYGTESGGVAVP